MRNYRDKFHSLRKGLKKVNIGDDVWLCGKQSKTRNGLHMVIYGPNNKEYHVYGDDVREMCTDYNEYGNKDYSNCNRHGNSVIHYKLKIYILTAILDKKENWEFDLRNIPENGSLKVICKNGMVRNIDFKGQFYPQEIISKRYTWKAGQ